ncbi:MAG: alkaline phosphatase family protein [Reyranella sp.]|nr:alkaline phosphatase family protein [Reyranella sp.]
MAGSRRAVFVCCDGLGRNWVRPDTTPVLDDLRQRSLWCDAHSAVFPSVTRVSAASVATGCLPARHGLHGNRMGLIEDGKIVVRDVGNPDFRTHMRRATGGTLLVPSLAERVAKAGGFIGFSNVSPGAAYFLDPEHFGHIYHRAGSYAPGGARIEGTQALEVSHDAAGDWAMTERFCREVLEDRRPAAAFLWLADPDHTLHGVPLGSPAHHDALAAAGRCVSEVFRTVGRLREEGEEILLLVGSDHGQETIGAGIAIEDWLAARGLAGLLEAGDVAVAGQGTAALFYATDRGRAPLLGILDEMSRAEWAGEILAGERLGEQGFAALGGVVAAVDMARQGEANPYGVAGRRWVAAEQGKPVPIGSGQHGGWGPDETRPFLMMNDGGRSSGTLQRPTCITDIAPTIARFLGLPGEGFDGKCLTS